MPPDDSYSESELNSGGTTLFLSSASSSSHKIPTSVIIPSAVASTQPQQTYYVCEDCDKAFSTASHLTRHRLVHSREMKYPCTFPGCTTRCTRKDNLRQQ
ncbi:hypothetical protein K438DRAFT_1578154 [Mycena galopus ATCC 62051]|nr:hypothetical protein K438DRAFT_1578154 [Mycena galopus ATCC 62051]